MMIDSGTTRKSPSYSYVLSVRRSEALFPILLKIILYTIANTSDNCEQSSGLILWLVPGLPSL